MSRCTRCVRALFCLSTPAARDFASVGVQAGLEAAVKELSQVPEGQELLVFLPDICRSRYKTSDEVDTMSRHSGAIAPLLLKTKPTGLPHFRAFTSEQNEKKEANGPLSYARTICFMHGCIHAHAHVRHLQACMNKKNTLVYCTAYPAVNTCSFSPAGKINHMHGDANAQNTHTVSHTHCTHASSLPFFWSVSSGCPLQIVNVL